VDLLGGQVDVMFDNLPNVLPHVTGGKMRALAITSPKRSSLAPEIPTVAESGWPGFDVSVWYALAAPANTSAAIITKLNTEINKILLMDDVKKIFAEQGVEPMGGTPEQYAEFSKAQTVKWSKVIGAANIKAE
jgi:tripartite-type tricarboxylate transporter receptor subunit TctC